VVSRVVYKTTVTEVSPYHPITDCFRRHDTACVLTTATIIAEGILDVATTVLLFLWEHVLWD
jgi:hypothetical protein